MMNNLRSAGALWLFLALLPAAAAPTPVVDRPLDPAKLRKIDAAIEQAIEEQRLPGAVVWVEHGGEHYWKAYGNRALVPREEPMTRDTIFDAASLTKVLATTPAVMLLVERGKIKLDATVQSYIPEFTGDGKEAHHRAPIADPYLRPAGGRQHHNRSGRARKPPSAWPAP